MEIFQNIINRLVHWTTGESNYQRQVLYLFVLTLTIMFVGGIFNVPGVVDNPQFTANKEYAVFIKELVYADNWLCTSYFLFFLVDFFWAATLLVVMYKTVVRYYRNRVLTLEAPQEGNRDMTMIEDLTERGEKWAKLLSTVFVLAYASDFVENWFYVLAFRYINWLAYTKIGLYLLSLLLFLFALLPYIIGTLLPLLWKFMRAAALSLVVIVVLGFFLPKAEQVNSIVVELYTKPWNMIILLLVVPIFAIVIAHYPSYFGKNLKYRNWYRAKTDFMDLLGVVYYKYKPEFFGTKQGGVEAKLNYLFRLLGVLFYAALFFMLAYTSKINFSWMLDMGTLSIVLFLSGAGLLYHLKVDKDAWYAATYQKLKDGLDGFYDGDYQKADEIQEKAIQEKKNKQEEPLANDMEDPCKAVKPLWKKEDFEKVTKALRWPLGIFIGLFTWTFVWHLVLFSILIFCKGCRYSWLTVALSLLCVASQMFTFIYYRSYRSLLRFGFFNGERKAVTNSFIDLPDEVKWFQMDAAARKALVKSEKTKIICFFKVHDFVGENRIFKFLSRRGLGSLSNNITFLQINAIMGLLNAFCLLILNIDSALATNFSTILIILSALFLYYGIVVVLVKNRIFYKFISQAKNITRKPLRRFDYFMAGLFVLFFVAFAVTRLGDNKLFSLQTVPRSPKKEVTLKSYVDTLAENNGTTRYFIGCYGGGLKSNGWTMTVLEELYQKDKNFINKMVGISGASGGTMGMVNWFAIQKGYHDASPLERQNKIKEIATENILSLDVTHILGRDSFGYLFVPTRMFGADRSSKAMERLAGISGDWKADHCQTPYRQYWKELYERYNKRFPIFIANTTNVQGNQGMALSVNITNDDVENLVYQNADNILEIDASLLKKKGKNPFGTLAYYDASATSNRFPMLSPAAKIETKGHFNDGGIYENSGLLSVYKLFKGINHLEKRTVADLKQKNVFINIINDKDLYVRKIVDELSCKVKEINYYGEASIILRSVVSTEMMPKFIKTELQRLAKDHVNVDFHSVYLPHLITVQDIKDVFGKTLICGDQKNTEKFLLESVHHHNAQIYDLINPECQWGDKPIVEPAVSRATAGPAYDFMYSMLKHDRVQEAIKAILE